MVPDGRFELHRALAPPNKKHNPSDQICEHYVNASAFAARFFKAALTPAFYVHGPTRRLGRSLAFSAIETATGGEIPNPELLSCHYIAAAQWIVVAVGWLFEQIRWGHAQHCELTETADGNQALSPQTMGAVATRVPAVGNRWRDKRRKVMGRPSSRMHGARNDQTKNSRTRDGTMGPGAPGSPTIARDHLDGDRREVCTSVRCAGGRWESPSAKRRRLE